MDSYDREWGTGAPLPQGAKQVAVSTEPRAQSGPEFACSAWLGELEAALRDTAAQWRRYSQEQMDDRVDVYCDMKALERVIEIMRRRSPSNV